ncbi:MAG: hypothetical protein HKN32_05710 [Flavobacteriales bacterium]|nr:hypothetical protein [Flavobacteriales bacterium]
MNEAILYTLNMLKRRSVVILISDFIDEGYYHNLKGLARRHDLVIIRVTDKRETQLPKLGLVPVLDKESSKTLWINTSFGGFRNKIKNMASDNFQELSKFSKRNQVNFVNIDTNEDYVPKLLKLFKVRNKSFKSV